MLCHILTPIFVAGAWQVPGLCHGAVYRKFLKGESAMPKNLIVCSDGTGNKGGSTPSSNVYRVYKAVDKHYKSK